MEIEAKFSLPDEHTLERLGAVDSLAGFVLSAGRVKHVRDTYLDTAERAILAAGYACRQREQADGVLVTLKGLGGAQGAVHRRQEIEMLLPEARPPAEWPSGPLRDWVSGLLGDARLEPLFQLEQTRTIRQVRQGERQVAELCLDAVRLVTGGDEHAYCELEVELAPDGTEKDLAAIATDLQKDPQLVPQPASKFERALGLLEESRGGKRLLTPRERAILARIALRDDMYARRAQALLALDHGATQAEAGRRSSLSDRRVRFWLAAFRDKSMGIFPARVLDETIPAPLAAAEETSPTEPPAHTPAKREIKLPARPGLEPDDSMAEAARKTFRFHYQRMCYHEPGTRLGEDIEELHDMRVATRRMRAAFQVFGDTIDLGQMAPLLKGLRRTGRILGAVRDLDVFWEKSQHYLDTLPPDRQNGLEPLKKAWAAERERARERMRVYLDGERYLRFKDAFDSYLQTPGAGALPAFSEKGEPVPNRLRHVVPVLVYQRLTKVRAYDEWVTGDDIPLERLHRLRIAAKGLRYTLEFFQEVLGPEAKTLIKEIKGLQDHLGDLQDAVVASNLLRDFLTWGTWGHAAAGEKHGLSLPSEPVVAPGVAAYLAARQTELQHLLDTFPETWTRIQSLDFSHLVAAALTRL